MLESLVFIFLILIGGLGLVAGTIVLTIGLIKKSKNLKTAGMVLCGLPVLSAGLIFLYYGVVLPIHYDRVEINFSGQYVVDKTKSPDFDTISPDNKDFHLNLTKNLTFNLDSTPNITFHGKGQWKSCRSDFGEFLFYDISGAKLGQAKYFDNDGQKIIIFNYGDEDKKVRFKKIKKAGT